MSVGPINRIETESCKLRTSHLHYAIDAAKNPDLHASFKPFNLTLHPVRCSGPLLRKGEKQSRLWRFNSLDILDFAIIKVLTPATGRNQSGHFEIASCLCLTFVAPFSASSTDGSLKSQRLGILNEHRILLYNPVCNKSHSQTASKTFIPRIVIFWNLIFRLPCPRDPVKHFLTVPNRLT